MEVKPIERSNSRTRNERSASVKRQFTTTDNRHKKVQSFGSSMVMGTPQYLPHEIDSQLYNNFMSNKQPTQSSFSEDPDFMFVNFLKCV